MSWHEGSSRGHPGSGIYWRASQIARSYELYLNYEHDFPEPASQEAMPTPLESAGHSFHRTAIKSKDEAGRTGANQLGRLALPLLG